MNHAKTTLLLASLSLLASCSGSTAGLSVSITWAEGYENCHVSLVSESSLINCLAETDFGAIPSNTALTGNLTASPIFTETDPSLVSAKANVIAARKTDYEAGGAYAKKINALALCLASPSVSAYIVAHYSGKVSYAYEDLQNIAPNGDYSGSGTIRVVASQSPHKEILDNAVAPLLKSTYGYDLSVTEQDWSIQNETVSSGEADANYFQHVPYLNTFTPTSGQPLAAICKVHYEPLGVYKGGTAKQDEIYNGATIEVCNDSSNCERALELLKYKGYIASYSIA